MQSEFKQMSETSNKELDNMEQVSEDAATGTAAITKGATSGEKIDTSQGNFNAIGGSDSKGNPNWFLSSNAFC